METIKLPMTIIAGCGLLLISLGACSETTRKPVRQHSFSCSKARTQAERIVCSSDDLRALDSKMTSRYQRAMGVVAHPDRLRDDQRHWISEVRNTCDSRRCLYSAYRERIEELQAARLRADENRSLRTRLRDDYGSERYTREPDYSNYDDDREWNNELIWQGKWTKESYYSKGGGMLRIKQINGQRLSFRLYTSSERGRGEIMGEAPIDGNYAMYRDRADGCEVEMYIKNQSIEVNASKACQRYSEGRADFNGIYRKE